VPWSGEPTGALIAPLVLLAMVYSRKKRRGKLDIFIILLVLCLAVGMSLAACGPKTPPGEASPTSEPRSTQSNQDNNAPTQSPVSGTPGGNTNKGSNLGNPGSGSKNPSADSTVECYGTPTSTPTPTPTMTPPSLTGDAKIAYETFTVLRDHLGWWNKNQNNMTSLDFLGIILSYEFGNEGRSINPQLIKETAVRNFYVKCQGFTGHPCSPDSDVDIFTYIAKKDLLSMRSGYILKPGDDPNLNLFWNPENATRSNIDFPSAFRTADPKWKRAYFDQAIEWVNKSLIKPTLWEKIMAVDLGFATDEVVARSGNDRKQNTMFILTLCQTNHWEAARPVGYGQDETYGVKYCGEIPGWTQ